MQRSRNLDTVCQLLNEQGGINLMGVQGWRAIAATSHEEIVGKAWWDFWPPCHRDRIKRTFSEVLSGQQKELSLMRERADGSVEQWVFELSPVPGVGKVPTSVWVRSDTLVDAA